MFLLKPLYKLFFICYIINNKAAVGCKQFSTCRGYEMQTINLNDKIKVVLNDRGKGILDEAGYLIEGDCYEFPVWQFMDIFGKSVAHQEPITVKNEICLMEESK